MTNGQTIAKTLRTVLSIGPRTKRFPAKHIDNHERIIRTIYEVAYEPVMWSTGTREGLKGSVIAALAYSKHVAGSRIDGMTIAKIQALTPYQFAGFLGSIVDAGVTNVGEAEGFFKSYGRES